MESSGLKDRADTAEGNAQTEQSQQANNHTKVDYEDEQEEKKRGRFLWLFVVNMALICLSFLMLAIYNNVMLRTLEKRFGLSSFQTGMLSSANDIMQIALVVFIAYFGNKGHKPRIISVTVMFSSVAGFLMALPHFFFHDYDERHATTPPNNTSLLPATFNLASNSTKALDISLCLSDSPLEDQCSGREGTLTRVHPAYYVFVTAQVITGVGASALYTLSMAYIDENAPKNKLSIYLAFFMCMFSLSPILGMMLAGFCLRLPENLLSGDEVNLDDPTFVGCWWLGYVIAASLLSCFAIPLSFFPTTMKKERQSINPLKEAKAEEHDKLDFNQQAKKFPRALLKLMSNKLYILNLCQIVCGAYTIYGMYVNLVRFIETHFLYSATVASIISGVTSSAIGGLGSLTGGMMVSRLKLDTKQTMKLILIAGVVYVAGVVVLVNIRCPQVQMDMTFNGNPYDSSVENSCSESCNCLLDRKSYHPVCGSNGISYYSPCMAGCSSFQNNTFKDCKCLRKVPLEDFDFKTAGQPLEFLQDGVATAGYCTPKCKMFVVFTVVLVLMSFCTSVTRVPGTMINFNIVDKDERSFALGINSFILNLFGFIPSPLIFGRLIDSSCILWQWTCNQTGACLLFDTARLRYSIYGATLFVESLELCFFFAMFLLIPKRPLHSPHQTHPQDVFQTDVEVNGDTQVTQKKTNEKAT